MELDCFREWKSWQAEKFAGIETARSSPDDVFSLYIREKMGYNKKVMKLCWE